MRKSLLVFLAAAVWALSSAPAIAQCTPDAFEEDDACLASKTVIRGGDTQSHNFCQDAEDWLKFNACAGRTYTIDAVPIGPLADVVLELYDADCASLLDSDYGGAPGAPASIMWTAPVDGTYHIKVLQNGGGFGDNHEYDVTLTGDTSSCSAWARSYGGTNTDQAYSIQQTSDGGYVVAGTTVSFVSGNFDFWVLKLDTSGSVQWKNRFDASGNEAAYSVQQTSDGGYVVAGDIDFGPSDSDFWVLKLNPDLTIDWQKSYGGGSYEWAYSIQQTADDGYVVAGETRSFGGGGGNCWILKLYPDGTIDWEKTYGGASNSEYANSIQQTADGGYIVAGRTMSFGAGGTDFWVLKLNPDGTIDWEETYGDTGFEEAASIQQTADGGFVVAGMTSSFGVSGYDAWVLKLNPDGTIAWEKTYGSAETEIAYSVQQTADGGYVVAGETSSFGAGNWDVWVLKLDAAGSIEWEKAHGSVFNDRGESIQQTADGGYVVAGLTGFGAGGWDFWVLKLRENGEIHFPACALTEDSAAYVEGTSAAMPGSTAVSSPPGATVASTGALDGTSTETVEVQCASGCAFSVTCSAGVDAAAVCIGTQQNFTGSVSGSGEGALSYAWDFDYDGVTFDVMATGTTASYIYPAAGDFTAAFRVADSCADPAPQECISTIAITIYPTGSVVYDTGFTPLLAQVCGDGDLIVEPGEEWQVTVQLLNDTPCAPVTNVKADLTVNAGSAVAATVSGNPGIYGDMPPYATSQFTYSFVVDPAAACSNDITFDVTNIVSDEGPYPDQIPAFNVWVGVVLFSEDFENIVDCAPFPPAGWTEVEGGFNTNGWEPRGPDCPSGCASGYPLPTNFAINDSQCEGFSSWQNTELITPLIDAGAATAVELRFDHDFQGYWMDFMFDDLAIVQVKSTNTGGAWVLLDVWDEFMSVTETATYDVTPQCAGAADCQFEWYYTGNDDLHWAIDNVIVSAALPCEASGAIITPSGPTTFCEGGSVTLTASSTGTPPFTYLWSPNSETTTAITVTVSGTYSVTITDAGGCVYTSADEVVTVDAFPTAVITPSGPTTFCEGGSVILTASSATGKAPFTYLWAPGGETTTAITVTASGTYSVTITGAAPALCADTSADEVVTVDPSPTAVITPSGPTTFCAGGSVTLTASSATGTPPFTYQWYESGIPLGVTTAAYMATASGTYSVEIWDANNCSDISADEVVTVLSPAVAYDTFFDPVATLAEDCGDGDAVVEPGERWSVTVQLENTSTCDATGVLADLAVNAGSVVAATVCNNPGSYGDILALGKATFTYSFEVDSLAVCVNDITFDVTGITSNEGGYPDNIAVFNVTVGAPGVVETATQVSPLVVKGGTAASDLAPAFTIAKAAAISATVDWGSLSCQGVGLADIYTSSGDDLVGWTVSGKASSDGGSPDDCPGGGGNNILMQKSTWIERTVSTVGYNNITIRTDYWWTNLSPGECVTFSWYDGTTWTDWFGPSGPGIVCGGAPLWPTDQWYCNVNTGILVPAASNNPNFAIRFALSGSNNQDRLRLDQIIVEGFAPGCQVTGDTRVTLIAPDLSTSVLKNLGEAPNPPYDVLAFYQTKGPGTYQIELYENSGTGDATLTGTVMSVGAAECDVSACACLACISFATVSPGGPISFCAGGSVDLGVLHDGIGPFTYLWSPGGETTRTITVTANGTYSCDVTDNDPGCGNTVTSDSVVVMVYPNPTAVITPSGPTTFCEGGSVILTASSATGTPPFTYLWAPGGETTTAITVTASGTYSVTIVDANGCMDASAGEVVTVNANPTAVITPSGPTTFCEGGSVILTASSATGTPPFTYLWAPGGETTAAITVTASGTYSVTITDSAVPPCVDTSAGEVVTVNPLPTPVIIETCGAPNITLDAGAGYVSYSWSSVPPGLPGDGATTQTIQVPCSSTGIYTVTVFDGTCFGTSPPEDVSNCFCSCITSATATALGPTTFCEGGSVDLVVTPDDGTGPFMYLWNTGAKTQTITALASDTYSCDVTDTEPGCGNTVTSNSVVVTVNANPTAVITPSGPTTFCEGGSVILTASSATGTPPFAYLWAPGGETTTAITVTTAGVYSVTITDSAVPACSDTTVPGTTVTVNPLPTPVILETCGAPNTTLDAGAGYVSYSWTSVPPGEPGDGATTQTIQVPSCDSTGSYTVTVFDGTCFGTSPAEDVSNCMGSCCITSATATALGPTTFCEGGSVDLEATPDDGVGPFTYLWSPGGETTQTITVGVADTYFCDVTDNDLICGNTVTTNSIVVTVNPLPTPVIIETCGVPFSTLDAGAGYLSYSWSTVPPGEPGDGATTQTIQVPCDSTGIYTVTVFDGTCFGTSPPEDVTNCICNGGEPCEPSDTDSFPFGVPPLRVVNTAGTLVDVEDESGCGATAYVVYEEAIGTWYGFPAGQSGCLAPLGPGGEPGTARLDYVMGAPDVWIVVTAANAAGESSAGRSWDLAASYMERDTAPGWPAPVVCP